MHTAQNHTTGAARVVPARIEVKNVCDLLGAEVTGLDVRDDAAVDAQWDTIQSLLRDRHIILFRNQELDEDSLGHFAERFGEFERAYTQRADGSMTKPVNRIVNVDKDGNLSRNPWTNTNYYWHSDRANFPNGSAMVMLFAHEIPPAGGDTQFANMILAYEGLSAEDKKLLANLRAVHSFEYKRLTLEGRGMTDAERNAMPPPSVHPLVRTDPKTGRKNLYLGMYACEIVGMPLEEGRALLKRLEEHCTQERFVYTHKWTRGDFFIWDNLCLMHRALRNYEMDKQRRVMIRCGIKATQPIQ